MFWFRLSSLTHVDIILSLFQICINSQGEKNTSQFLELVEYNQTLLSGCLSIVQLTYSLFIYFYFRWIWRSHQGTGTLLDIV